MRRWRYQPARDQGLGGRARLASIEREPDLLETALLRVTTRAVRLWLGGFEHLEVTGRHRLPAKPPFVLVSNHTSHLDAIALHAALPSGLRAQVFPIAAADTFYASPVAATLASVLLNTLPIWRRRSSAHALAALRTRLLEQPCGYILFPEGTRSRDGTMRPFKPGVGMLVAGTDVPVFPCRVRGAYEAWPPGRPLPGPGHVRVRIGRPLTFGSIDRDRHGWNHVAETLERAVNGDARGERVLSRSTVAVDDAA